MVSLVSRPHHQLLGCSTESCSSPSCSSSSSSSYSRSSRVFVKDELIRLRGSNHSSGRSKIQMIGVRATGVDYGRIGSRRKKGGLAREDTEPVVDQIREPFLQTKMRQYRDEGHLVLDDAEELLGKANNPFGLVLEIAEEANDYLRNNKEESLRRKPVLKIISDRINEAYGEQVRDSYINEKEDYSEYESDYVE